jgi:hypothetical protein
LDAGGSITFTTAPASGNVVSIVRSTDLTQLTDYVPDDNFNADDHEDALDKLTLIAQENFQKLLDENGDPQGRALIYPASDAASISNVVPASELRPNLLFQWNNASEPTTVAPADLNLVTLDNDTTLGGGSPSALSGVTQLAVKTYIDNEDTTTRTGIGSNADGTYNTPSGTNFLDSTTDVMDALDTIDEKVQCAWNGAIDLNTRVTTLEAGGGSSTKLFTGTGSSTQLQVTFSKATAEKWQELELHAAFRVNGGGSFTQNSVTISGSGGSSATNYNQGVLYENQFDEGSNTTHHSFICTVVPTDLTEDSITVTIGVTINNQLPANTIKVYGVGRLK